MKELRPLVAIVGPTASGKSALGVRLAEEFGGEVVACDSTQVYRHFNIGTAKPSLEERRGITHHLLDIVEPEELFTAGDYRLRALAVLADLRQREKLPVFTAGTGLYLRALLEGLSDAPARSEEIRKRLARSAKNHGEGYLHRLLARLDQDAAARIAPRDTPKLIRAIEVSLLAGRPVTDVHRAGRPRLEGYAAIKVGLLPPRTALYARIERRLQAMLAAGWLEEVARLARGGIPLTAKPWQFIGYGQLHAHLAGELELKQAVAAILQATRRYAKRQITWFRRETGVRWFEGFGDDACVAEEVRAYLSGQLRGESPARAPGERGV
jgi:tRNA dimethylallyltransferase